MDIKDIYCLLRVGFLYLLKMLRMKIILKLGVLCFVEI